MEIQGRIKLIDETKAYGASGFKKRELVLTTDEQYPQDILVEFTQDKCELLNNYRPGNDVKIAINLRGKGWVNPQGETRYFNSIVGWNIKPLYENQGYQAPQHNQPPPQNNYGNNPSNINSKTKGINKTLTKTISSQRLACRKTTIYRFKNK